MLRKKKSSCSNFKINILSIYNKQSIDMIAGIEYHNIIHYLNYIIEAKAGDIVAKNQKVK